MLIRNSLAHLIARLASLGAGLISIPLVAMTLGTESLGLVGVYATFLSMLGLFDLGLPMSVNHRLAVLVGRDAPRLVQDTLIRSLETVFWLMVGCFLLAGLLAKGPLTHHWLNVERLPRDLVETCLLLIVIGVAIRFPVAFYSNVLFAFDRHFYPNAVITASAVARTAVALVALVHYQVGLIGFFVIQLVANAFEVILLAAGVWYASPNRLVRPQWIQLRQLAGTAGILTAISLTSVGLLQIDKIILSKLLTLEDFGIYSAAYVLASGVFALSYPVGNAAFPQLSQSLNQHKWDAATGLVRLSTEATVLLVVPLGCVLALQSGPALDLLFLVRDVPPQLAAILPLMMLGGIANGLVTLPHLFQVASARALVVLWINVAFVVPYAVLAVLFSINWGVWGGALAFALFNFVRLFVHWAVLLMSPAAAIWRPIPAPVIGAIAASMVLAWAVTLMPASQPGRIMLLVVSVPVLMGLLTLGLPLSRQRLLARLHARQ